MGLTVYDIENATVGQLFEWADEFGITANNTSELKQKLIVEVMKKDGSIINLSGYAESVIQEKEETIQQDEKRRERLSEYLKSVTTIYNTIMCFEKIKEPVRGELKITERDDPLISFISNEIKDVAKNFEIMAEIVQRKPNCSLLICGDSGAGKSSFINLLLNKPLLPTSIRSNSSCQVRLTSGEPERAEIVDLKDEKHVLYEPNLPEQVRVFLENVEDRKTVSCNSATIYLKSLILEGGLDIYDTIGLGETEMFNNELKKELNQITGIIFLLKKNNPIGDETIGGLSEIIRQLTDKGLTWRSMNFIINMCDLLPSSKDKEELKNNVKEQLREKCTLLESEVTTFSTKQELYFQKNDVMTKDYKNIIQLIHQLHISSINTNTVKVFSFLIQFVRQTIDQINELEKYSSSNREERKQYILTLRNLECDRNMINQSFSKTNLKYLIEEKRSCRKKVDEYFRNLNTKTTIVTEVVGRQGELYGMTVISEIDDKIEEMCQEEISKSFKKFIERENILKKCCDKMLTMFIEQYNEHLKKKDEIHKAMNRHIDTIMDSIECDFKDIISTQTNSTGFLRLISPILVPIVLLTEYIKKNNWFSAFYAIFNKVNINSFYQDTTSYVTKQAAAKYAKYFSRSSNTKNLIDCLFTAPEKVTLDFENYLTTDMDYLSKNIQSLVDDMRKKDIVYSTYKEIKEQLNLIHEELCRFNLIWLHKEKKHIMRDKITFLPLTPEEPENVKPVLKSLGREVFRGQINDDLKTECFIMVYQNKNDKTWRHLYDEYKMHNEISTLKLRKECQETSKYFLDLERHVIFYIDGNVDIQPTFLVRSVDSSLKNYMTDKRKSLRAENQKYEEGLYEEMCRLLKQILSGLKYLHDRSFVHFDLTGDSIGYCLADQTIKLTSISLPTKVNVNHDETSLDYVISLSHLPVSVLDKETQSLYDASSDIYCLGILVYLMWLDLLPFYNVIYSKEIATIDGFVNQLKTQDFRSIMLIDVFHHNFGHLMFHWSCRCMTNSITLAQFLDELGRQVYYGNKEDTR